METQTMKVRISPGDLSTIIHQVTYSGDTFGVYSGMSQTLSGGTNGDSLLTGLTIPVLLVENTVDVGYYSVFDGAILQKNVVNNFIFSSTTTNPFTWYVYNTSDIEFNAFLQLSSYFIDWGDGSALQPITTYSPNGISHNYPNTADEYTITMYQNNPWGNTTISKVIQTPFVDVPNFNPQGTAYFTPNVGSWSATPISYNFIFTGDSENVVSAQTSNNYTTVPFTITGLTSSRLSELASYGNNKYQLLVPIQRDGVDYGIITDLNLAFTAYTIEDVNYIDYPDGVTIYSVQSSGLISAWMVAEPLVKDELLLGVSDQAEIQSNVFIERGKNSAYERVQRIGEVDNLGDLIKYGYRFFNVI
jgi:hypothetical protein